jgi:Cysteine rich repeat
VNLRLPLSLLAVVMSAGIAPSMASAQDIDGLKSACMSDVVKYCRGVEPGEGRMAQCLILNAKQVSPVCLEAMADMVATQVKKNGN